MQRVELASDSAVLVQVGSRPGVQSTNDVLKLAAKILERYPDMEIHPGYCSLLIEFDPFTFKPLELMDYLRRLLSEKQEKYEMSSRVHTVPVRYGGEFGPDLADVAKFSGHSPDDVVEMHASGDYTVAFLGFAPGFPYLLGLDERLHCPRKTNPRLKVEKGSVGIGGAQTGIYPAMLPGGWNIIGRTDLELFNPQSDPPALLSPGDRVRFKAVR